MSRPNTDLWKQLVADAGVEEIDRAAAMSVKDAEAELTAAGFDVAAERAKATAFLEALESAGADEVPDSTSALPEPPPSAATAVAQHATPHGSVYPRRKPQRPVVLWLAAAATVAVAGGALYAALHQPPAPGPGPEPPSPSPSTSVPSLPSVPDLVAAVRLRNQAAGACDAQDWSVCLAKLDQARASDPDGDDALTVKALRDRAIAGILKKPTPP